MSDEPHAGRDLEKAALDALNAYLQDNNGRAPRLLEASPANWLILKHWVELQRETGAIAEIPPVAPERINGRPNFVILGLPCVAGTDDVEGIQAHGG